MFPFTEYVEQCLEALEASPRAIPTDALLTAWGRLQRIIDISAAALGLRSHDNAVNVSDAGTQLTLQNCTKQLQDWKKNVPLSAINGKTFH